MKLKTRIKILAKTLELMRKHKINKINIKTAEQAAKKWYQYNAACKKYVSAMGENTGMAAYVQLCSRDDGAMIIYAWATDDYNYDI